MRSARARSTRRSSSSRRRPRRGPPTPAPSSPRRSRSGGSAARRRSRRPPCSSRLTKQASSQAWTSRSMAALPRFETVGPSPSTIPFSDEGAGWSLALLVAAAILLDFGMTANLTLGQRAIFVLAAEFRSRLNGLYMAAFFAGGAAGSTLGGWAYADGGWPLTSWVGFGFPIAALVLFLIELGVRFA